MKHLTKAIYFGILITAAGILCVLNSWFAGISIGVATFVGLQNYDDEVMKT